MIFSYNWLKEYTKKLPKPEKLAEILTMHSFEVENVKKLGKDYVLNIDVLPNRAPDCFSHLGIAREAAALIDSKLEAPKCKLKEDKKLKAKDFVKVEVKDKNDCLRYTARIVVDVKVGPSPKWIQERLKVCGLKPINNIVDIANYVMLETGQPLHAFDFEKIESINPKSKTQNPNQIQNPLIASQLQGAERLVCNVKTKKIIIRKARKGEKIVSLDNKKYDLDEDILIIADLESPLAIAGIKGGKKAEIDKKTKTIVLESANFDYRVIRKASKKIDLRTDASWRFENKIDPNLTGQAINRAAYLIQDIAGAKIASGLADFYPKKVLPKKIILNQDYINKLLGIKISMKEIRKILNKLEFKVIGGGQVKTMVEIPTFRLDIFLTEDLIEEIGRIYSYENIPAVFPVFSSVPPKRNFDVFWEDNIKNILKEAGFSEVYNYSFIGDKEANLFNYKPQEIIELENPISKDQKYLRPSLIPNLIKNIEGNFRYFDKIKIFEIGNIFISKNLEKRMLAGVIAEKVSNNKLFYQAKGAVDLLLNKLGISDIWYDEHQPSPEKSKIEIWHLQKAAEIKIGSEEIGFLGEISPKISQSLKNKGKIVLFDIDLEKLIKLCSEEHQYQPISQHPAAVRDLAVLVPSKIKVEDVLNKINAVEASLIRDIDLFDIYEGKEIPQGKKNLAFHIIYQAEDRTLTAKEIDALQHKIINTLEQDPEWEVRR